MKPFRAPDESIGSLDAASVATLVATSSDVALVMDGKGVIQDMAIQPTDLSAELEGYGRWFGRAWSDTVASESRHKIDTILDEAARNAASAPRQLTHKAANGRDVPILYSAVKVGPGDRIVALGRDMRAVSTLQQRLIDAQMSMERDYARLRSAETRYRLLFQTSAEPVLVLEGAGFKVLEANPAAAALLERGARRVVGRPFPELVAGAHRGRAQQLLGDLRGGARAEDAELALTDVGAVVASGALLRQEGSSLVLLRLSRPEHPRAPALPHAAAGPATGPLAELIQASPDGFVVTDGTGRVVAANASFAAMAQVADPAALAGGALEDWFGRTAVDFDLAAMSLRQHGTLRLFPTLVRGAEGGEVEVEVSAVALGAGKEGAKEAAKDSARDVRFAFSVRDVGRRLAAPPRSGRELPRSADELAELIGRVPLKELVRETTDVIEKLCIEAALDLTGDNRASAAELLGLSRQSLYVKLRRFGLAEAEDGA